MSIELSGACLSLVACYIFYYVAYLCVSCIKDIASLYLVVLWTNFDHSSAHEYVTLSFECMRGVVSARISLYTRSGMS